MSDIGCSGVAVGTSADWLLVVTRAYPAFAVTTETLVRTSTGSIGDADRGSGRRIAITPTNHTGFEGVGVSDSPS